jgi:hypothetical protein
MNKRFNVKNLAIGISVALVAIIIVGVVGMPRK